MRNLRAYRLWSGRLGVIGCLAALLASTTAHADGANILGSFLNAMGGAIAISSWQKVDPQTQECLAARFNMNPQDLMQQGVLATDPRVTPYIAQCQQLAQQGQDPQAGAPQQASLNQEQSPEDQEQRRADLAGRYGKRDTNLIMQGQIGIGMNPEEVILAWGDPRAKTTKGKGSEVWNYGDDTVVFTRGKVSAVTH